MGAPVPPSSPESMTPSASVRKSMPTILASVPIDATDATFERDVIQRSHEQTALVAFWAAGCAGGVRLVGGGGRPLRSADARAGEGGRPGRRADGAREDRHRRQPDG